MATYIIESIGEPYRYYQRHNGWVEMRIAATEYTAEERGSTTLPDGGCWVLIVPAVC